MNTDLNKTLLRKSLEEMFVKDEIIAYWGEVYDPDDGSTVDVLRVLNVPSNRLVTVDDAAYDEAFKIFGDDWSFLIDIRHRREVEAGGCYRGTFLRLKAKRSV